MKRFFMILFALVIFASCQNPITEIPKVDTPTATTPTTETPTPNEPTTDTPTTETPTPTPEVKPYYVKNSVWENVDISTITTARSVADPSLDEALAIVAEYNDANNDNQLFLYMTDVPITEAPTVTIYYAKAIDGYYEIVQKVENADRSWFANYRQTFVSEAEGLGCVLFVDKVPETAPVIIPIIDTRTPYEKYAIYAVITATSKIYIEEHCQDAWDSVYSKETNCMYTSVDDYFNHRLAAFVQEAPFNGWTIYSGQIYVEPAE